MIRKLLVANRGEIASRVMRTARAMGVATVAVFSDADEHAPFVADADEAVRLKGDAPADTYLRADLLIDAARRTGADALHPGYGFLSENADFARACDQAGIVFVGPPARAIELMGSKLEAKRLMAEAGVPVLPGATLDAGSVGDRALDAAREIGFPIMVKAAFGGGGRGMRVVASEAELRDAVDGAQREAASAFGDGTVFLERFVESPRHVEVQVFGDMQGTVVHLFERECSIQRRHQKIIEESPSPALDGRLREEMCQAAVAAAKAIGYVGAGTVEFVLDAARRFWFLEVNTRLQVEHPVTEMITGLDLVELQLRIAQGEPLPAAALDATMHGHAVEARVYAEDAAAGFLPVSGPVHRFRVNTGEGLRVDAGYADGSSVSTFYDAMLAKVIAWAPTRASAIQRLADALAGAEIHGVTTNRDLLVGVLRAPSFLDGHTDTGFLDRHGVAELEAGAHDAFAAPLHAVAATVARREERRAASPLPMGIPAGFRNVGPAAQPVTYLAGEVTITTSVLDGRTGVELAIDGEPHDLMVHAATVTFVDIELDGRRVRCAVHAVGDVVYVDSALGATALHVEPRFPTPEAHAAAGSMLAPMPGAVVRVEVTVGQSVAAGDLLVTLEAMKMEHALRAPHDGVVSEVRVAVGDQVDTDAVLVVVDAAEHSDG